MAQDNVKKENNNIKIDTINSSPIKINSSVSPDKSKILLRDLTKLKEEQPKQIQTNSNSNKPPEKKIDKEHVALEKIFRISLVEKESFLFLKEYSMGLQERKLEKAFRVADLDSIILSVITSNDKVYYYLTSLEGLYFLIFIRDLLQSLWDDRQEVNFFPYSRYKSEFDERFQVIRKTVVSYINIILNASDNFEIFIEKSSYSNDFKKFYNERNAEYIENLLIDFTKGNCSEYLYLKNFYDYYFEYIYHETSHSSSPNVNK